MKAYTTTFTLPDGSVRELPAGSSLLDLARDIGPGLAKAAVAAVVDGEVRLDLPYEEDSRAEVDMNVVATGSGRFVEVQGTGEDGTFSREQLAELTAMALGGIESLSLMQDKALSAAGGVKPRPDSVLAD